MVSSGTSCSIYYRPAACLRAGSFDESCLPRFCVAGPSGATVCFMTVAEKNYPKSLTFAYLDELKKEFMAANSLTVEKETRPFAYMSFGQ